MMRIAFLGTPEFAVPSLRALYERGDTLCLITQPDRPVGRHGAPVPPPTKRFALEHGIPVSQFARIRSGEGMEALRAFRPDLMVVVAFGQLLSEENLALPPLGCINVHGSLLPKYRGAAPIQWAVIDGEAETGVTSMRMALKMDAGDILLTDRVAIGPDETGGELYARLADVGAGTLLRTLDALERSTLSAVPQQETLATYCPKLTKEDGKLDFSLSASAVHNRVRGTNPWPGAYALLSGEPLKIWRTRHTEASEPGLSAGACFGDARRGLFVQCADRALEVLELQAPGGKRLDGASFLRGRPIVGQTLQ